MAIKSKFIIFDTLTNFLSTNGIGGTAPSTDYIGNIPKGAVVFIKNTGLIWFNGNYFGIDTSLTYATQSWVTSQGYTKNTGTVTSIATGAGLTGGTITTSGTIKANLVHETKASFATSETPSNRVTGRSYPVSLDSNGKLMVYVPWADNNTTSFTITANATDGLWDLTGTNGTNAVTYAVGAYLSQQSKASFDTSSTAPTRSDRLNYNGYLYATKLFSGGVEVLTSHQSLSNYYTKTESDNKYVYKSGDTITGNLTVNGTTTLKKYIIINPYDSSYGSNPIQLYWNDVKHTIVGNTKLDGTNNTAVDFLHSGNSSVSKSGETLTVKINGTSYSLTNTNTWNKVSTSQDGYVASIGSGNADSYNKLTSSDQPVVLAFRKGVNGVTDAGWFRLPDNAFLNNTYDLSKYLPLSGGTMTGAIQLKNSNARITFGDLTISPITNYKAPSLLSLGIGIYSRYGNSSDEGAIIITEDTCVIYNSADSGWNFQVMDKDLGTDMTVDATRSFGINASHLAYSLGGFVKKDSSNSDVLLGGGGTKAISDFALSSALDNYHPKNGKIIRTGGGYSWYNFLQYDSSDLNPSWYNQNCAIINVTSYTGWQPWIRGVDSENGSWVIGQYTTNLHVGRIDKSNTTNTITKRWDFLKDGSFRSPDGFIHGGIASNSYLLTANGGYKAISDFAIAATTFVGYKFNDSIGGRNYFSKNTVLTSNITKTTSINGYTINSSNGINRILNLGFNGYVGNWTVTFEIKASAACSVNVNLCDTSASTTHGEQSTTSVTTEYVKHRYVFLNVNRYNTAENNGYNGFLDIENSESKTIYVKDIKIEKGIIASDWFYAPEDLATQTWVNNLITNGDVSLISGFKVNGWGFLYKYKKGTTVTVLNPNYREPNSPLNFVDSIGLTISFNTSNAQWGSLFIESPTGYLIIKQLGITGGLDIDNHLSGANNIWLSGYGDNNNSSVIILINGQNGHFGLSATVYCSIKDFTLTSGMAVRAASPSYTYYIENTYSKLHASNYAIFGDLIPRIANSTYNLGSSTFKWNNLYLSNVLSDGTNSLTVANIKSTYDWYLTMTTGNTDGTINKWKEIESFVNGISDTSTLNGILLNYFRYRGTYSSTNIASSIPTQAELSDTSKLNGLYIVPYSGASGTLLNFVGTGSASYVLFYTTYNSGMLWRQSTDTTYNAWRTILDSSNYTSYINLSLSGYLPLSGGTMTGENPILFAKNTIALSFRTNDHASYDSKVEYMTNGNEALVFANKAAITSFIFKCGYSLTNSSNWYSSAIGTPTVLMKNQSLYVNCAIDSGVTPAYNLYVGGTGYISSNFSVNGLLSVTGAATFNNNVTIRGTLIDLPGLGEGFKIHTDNNYFGSALDGVLFTIKDGNLAAGVDGGIVFRSEATNNGTVTATDWLIMRYAGSNYGTFTWLGKNILHAGNTYISNGVITINGTNITPLTSHLSLANYLPLSGGTMNGGAQIVIGSVAHSSGNIYNGGIQLRERGYTTTSLDGTVYTDGPGITFHWGGRWVHMLNMHSNALYWDNTKISLDGHNHTFTLGSTTITTNGSQYTTINGPLAVATSASADNAFSIQRESASEGVKHWVDDGTYHIEYTNDEAANQIAFRFINTDTERSENKGADASDNTVYLNHEKNFYPSVNNTGSIGISSCKWANVYAYNFYGNASSATDATYLSLIANSTSGYQDSAKGKKYCLTGYYLTSLALTASTGDGYLLAFNHGDLYVTQIAVDLDSTYRLAIRNWHHINGWNDWKNILTNNNTYISNGTITIDGSSITPVTTSSITGYYWGSLQISSTINRLTIPTVKYLAFRKNEDNAEAGWVGAGSSGNNDIGLYAYSGQKLSLGSNGLTVITLDTATNVGIGTTNPRGKLDVKNGEIVLGGNGLQYPLLITRAYNDNVCFRIGSKGSGNDGLTMRIDNNTSGGGNLVYIDLKNGGAGVEIGPSLSVSGSVSATDFTATSDIRLKRDIQQISEHIYSFRFKDSDKLHYGFIALELEKNHPDLVGESEYKTVNYNSALSLYVAELENRVKMLENEINNLKNK